jgi:DNA-binding beta-propeller fold protein YncE
LNGDFIGTFADGELAAALATGMAVDSLGKTYLVSFTNHKVYVYAADGEYQGSWGTQGTGDGEFESPSRIAIDPDDRAYITDYGNKRVQKFTSGAGGFLDVWGEAGVGDGEFLAPTGIATSADTVYVADTNANRIQAFSLDGEFLFKWGTIGEGPGEFNGPTAVATDAEGNVYVADTGNNRVQKFTPDGDYLTEFGAESAGEFIGLNAPNALTLSGATVYVLHEGGVAMYEPPQ